MQMSSLVSHAEKAREGRSVWPNSGATTQTHHLLLTPLHHSPHEHTHAQTHRSSTNQIHYIFLANTLTALCPLLSLALPPLVLQTHTHTYAHTPKSAPVLPHVFIMRSVALRFCLRGRKRTSAGWTFEMRRKLSFNERPEKSMSRGYAVQH